MNRPVVTLLLPICLLFGASTYAEEETNNYAPLEMTEVTVRMTGGFPYGELRPCPDCPLRLLPFTPKALVYVNGQKMNAGALQNGQALRGTIFITSKPIDSITEIVAK